MISARVWAPLDDPRDVVRHDTAGASAEPGILKRFEAWIARQDDPAKVERYCEHSSYIGYARSLEFMCPRCPSYAEAADNSHQRVVWGPEELPDGFKAIERAT